MKFPGVKERKRDKAGGMICQGESGEGEKGDGRKGGKAERLTHAEERYRCKSSWCNFHLRIFIRTMHVAVGMMSRGEHQRSYVTR